MACGRVWEPNRHDEIFGMCEETPAKQINVTLTIRQETEPMSKCHKDCVIRSATCQAGCIGAVGPERIDRLAEMLIALYGSFLYHGNDRVRHGAHPGDGCSRLFVASINAFLKESGL